MRYYSTNGQAPLVSFREALFNGLAPDGGLYLPETIPVLGQSFFETEHSYPELAAEMIRPFVSNEITVGELDDIAESAFSFSVPLVEVAPDINILELFHGPTMAFKDFAARFMARIMACFMRDMKLELTVLVATSGDTGSAVASGFYDVEGIRVVILYPSGRVSPTQEKQLTTWGGNITALEVEGSFDDCQKLVKQAFLDRDLNDRRSLCSANSINIGRLLPQSVYYAWAWQKQGGVNTVFSVPSGNFGNLTGGLIAKRMGLPVEKFIAATNANAVFPTYLETGEYLPQPSKATISNAMDVGDPSNFQRIRSLYSNQLERIKGDIVSFSFTDSETANIIEDVYQRCAYVLDPHTAVGYLGLGEYRKYGRTDASGIIMSTAHPAKSQDCYSEQLKTEIIIPERLAQYFEREKVSIKLSDKYDDLRQFLIDY